MRRSILDEFGVALLVIALASGFWLAWLWGQVAAFLASGYWPRMRTTELPDVLMALPRHAGDPAQAWPASVADSLPGPVGMYAVLGLLVTPPSVASVWIVKTRVARSEARRRERDASSAWATKRDLAPLLVRSPEPSRLVLGRAYGRLVAAEPRMSAMVVAPTQTGKTTQIVIPNVRSWQGPALVTSVKSDVLLATVEERRKQGPVYVFDPAGLTGLESATWSPLGGCEKYEHAERVAAWLADAAHDDGPQTNQVYWETLGRKLLAPLLFAAASFERPINEVSRWLNTRAEPEISKLLEALGDGDALQAWSATCSREDRAKDAVYGTCEVLLSALASRSVRELTTVREGDEHALEPGRLLDEQGTVYLVSPESELRRLRPLFEALIQSLWREVERRYLTDSQPVNPSLLFMIDEAAHVAALRHLDLMAATGAGLGATLCTVWQDFTQVESRYGRRAATVWNNHRARLLLGGQADLVTLNLGERLAGDHRSARRSSSASGESWSEVDRPTLGKADLRTFGRWQGVLIYGNLPPCRVVLRDGLATGHGRALRRPSGHVRGGAA